MLLHRHAFTNVQARSIMGEIAVLLIMAAVTPVSTARAEGSWCANYSGNGGTNCGFYSFEQCMAAVSGAGGFCTQNGFYWSRSSTRR